MEVGERRELTAHRVHVHITSDDESTYSAVALSLPGAGSCGDSEEEALENAKEAIRAVLESYNSAGAEIPWKDSSAESVPFGAVQKWIMVHA